ncbi:hypothetical protein RFI_31389 [Reticulomyxa filosa]|uniref:Uncharacterized protein n=1 Tax=Reticulomyxa filosa TaxID=46433 RepID=X6LXY4_RETFI|nr:hypothetical protein RFI_31389 [Reticulomyxa filosa]|eukprot:ETO06007.1 hypothetical protein RFI_31389 [Reticulomyxa filosa]
MVANIVRLCAVLLLLLVLFLTKPDKASFDLFLRSRFQKQHISTESSSPYIVDKLGIVVLMDHSYDKPLQKSIFHQDFTFFFSIGYAQRSHYELLYLGILKHWIPLPYIPKSKTHIKAKDKTVYAFGLCCDSYCICIADHFLSGKEKKSNKYLNFILFYFIIFFVNHSKCIWYFWSHDRFINMLFIAHLFTFCIALRIFELPYLLPFHNIEWISNYAQLSVPNLITSFPSFRNLSCIVLSPFVSLTFRDLITNLIFNLMVISEINEAGISNGWTILLLIVGGLAHFLGVAFHYQFLCYVYINNSIVLIAFFFPRHRNEKYASKPKTCPKEEPRANNQSNRFFYVVHKTHSSNTFPRRSY